MNEDGRVAIQVGGNARREIETLAALRGETFSKTLEAAIGFYVYASKKRMEGGRILHEDARGNLNEVLPL